MDYTDLFTTRIERASSSTFGPDTFESEADIGDSSASKILNIDAEYDSNGIITEPSLTLELSLFSSDVNDNILGVNPNSFTIRDEDSSNTLVYGAANSEDIRRPKFGISSTKKKAAISYSSAEKEALSKIYEKPSLQDSIASVVSNISTNISGKMNEGIQRGFFFQKAKSKKAGTNNNSTFRETRTSDDICSSGAQSATSESTAITTTSSTTGTY